MLPAAVFNSLAGTCSRVAAAATSISRAAAPACRILTKPSRVEAEPPVPCSPKILLTPPMTDSHNLGGDALVVEGERPAFLDHRRVVVGPRGRAVLDLQRLQRHVEFFSATIAASVVEMPWPISARGAMTVMVLSLAIFT